MDTREGRIETVIGQNACLKNFKCYRNNFENLCKVRAIDDGKKLLECIDEGSDTCEFPFYLEHIKFCGCKVRAIIAQEFEL